MCRLESFDTCAPSSAKHWPTSRLKPQPCLEGQAFGSHTLLGAPPTFLCFSPGMPLSPPSLTRWSSYPPCSPAQTPSENPSESSPPAPLSLDKMMNPFHLETKLFFYTTTVFHLGVLQLPTQTSVFTNLQHKLLKWERITSRSSAAEYWSLQLNEGDQFRNH